MRDFRNFQRITTVRMFTFAPAWKTKFIPVKTYRLPRGYLIPTFSIWIFPFWGQDGGGRRPKIHDRQMSWRIGNGDRKPIGRVEIVNIRTLNYIWVFRDEIRIFQNALSGDQLVIQIGWQSNCNGQYRGHLKDRGDQKTDSGGIFQKIPNLQLTFEFTWMNESGRCNHALTNINFASTSSE